VLIVLLYGQSRIFFSMARDGLLPGFFSPIHRRFRTPYLSSLLVGIVVAIVAGLAPIDVVAELTNIGKLSPFVLVSAAVLILRRTQPAPRVPHTAGSADSNLFSHRLADLNCESPVGNACALRRLAGHLLHL
jgi:amino acid transporter